MLPTHTIPQDRGRRQVIDDRIPQPVENPPIIIPPLPIPDIVVVALRYGIFPAHEEWVRELIRRSPYLDVPTVRQFLQGSLRIFMPSAHTRDRNEGRCAICGSNWWGMPTIPHSTTQCPVPQQHRLTFQATNSRALCLSCRGTSEHHNWCRNINEHCRRCLEAGRGKRYHHPVSEICHIPDDEVDQLFRDHRIRYYKRVREESELEPFHIRFPNDEPLPNVPPAYNTYIGQKAMVVSEEAPGGVEYFPAAEYAGLVQTSQREERERVDLKLLQLQRDFYKDPFNWHGISEEERMQINAHREAIQRQNELRMVEGGQNQRDQQAEIVPEEGQQEAHLIPQLPGIQNQQVIVAPEEGQHEVPVAPQPQEPNAELQQELEVVPQHPENDQREEIRQDGHAIQQRAVIQALQEQPPASENQYVIFMMTTTMRTRALDNPRVQVPPNVANNPEQQQNWRQQVPDPPQEINQAWWNMRAEKVQMMNSLSLPMIKKLVVNAGNRTIFQRTTSDERKAQEQQRPFQVDIQRLRTAINDEAMDVEIDTQATIPILQRALSGRSNLPEVFQRQENGNSEWLDDYYELILSIGCVIVVSGRPIQTQMTNEHTESLEAFGWRIPYVIPDAEFFLDTPQRIRLPFFKLLTSSFAEQLDEDEE